MSLAIPPLSLAELCGTWGLLGSLAWSLAASRERMITIQLLTQPGFILHWALLGDLTACIASILLWALGFIAAGLGTGNPVRQLALRRAYLAALLPIAIAALAGWNGPASAFALLGTALSCYARWQTDPARFRDLLLVSSLPWLAHDSLMGSAPAVCADLLCLLRAAALHFPHRRRMA